MTVYYSDPWRENKFGSIYGNFVGETFSVHFDEVRIYRKDEKTLTLAGKFIKLSAVLRKFKPEQATMPVLLTLDLHKEDYEVNRKDESGNWTKIVQSPSSIEKFLYEQIEKDPVAWRLHGCTDGIPLEQMALKGWISFYDSPSIVSMLPENPGLKCLGWEITYCPSSSDSEWTPKAVNNNYGKGNGYGRNYIDENQRLEQREAKLTEILRRTHSSVLDASDLYTVSERLVPLFKQNPDAMDLYFKFLGLVYR
jgi:hypothetical protein